MYWCISTCSLVERYMWMSSWNWYLSSAIYILTWYLSTCHQLSVCLLDMSHQVISYLLTLLDMCHHVISYLYTYFLVICYYIIIYLFIIPWYLSPCHQLSVDLTWYVSPYHQLSIYLLDICHHIISYMVTHKGWDFSDDLKLLKSSELEWFSVFTFFITLSAVIE